MSNEPGKLAKITLEGLEFENDFGQSPIGLGHFSKDQGFIVVASLVGAFVGSAIAGLPLAAVVILVGLNDIGYANRKLKSESPITDVEEQPVEEFIDVPSVPINIPIGQNTRLNAIEVSAVPTVSTATTADIAMAIARIPKSTIIAASPRVGKGVVVSQAISNLKKLHPGLEIWLIDPKNEPTEQHYWTGIDESKRCHFDLRDFDPDTEQAIALFGDLLTKFNRSTSHQKLLIIDEFVTLSQKCSGVFMNQLKDFIVGICSSGEVSPDLGIGRFIWVISQSPYVSDLGFKTKAALSTFQRLLLINGASKLLYPLAVSSSFAPAGAEDKIERLLQTNPRICYYSRTDAWQIIPNYNLGSGDGRAVQDAVQTVQDTVQAEPMNRSVQRLNQPTDNNSEVLNDGSVQRFTPLNLSKERVQGLIENLNRELNQTQIIETLWQVRKGGTEAWKKAREEFKEVTRE